jgi:dolichol-phosphate mannosyltransferase
MTRKVVGLGAKIKEVPITFVEREFGVSKMSGNIVVEAMSRVTVWGLQRALKIGGRNSTR